MADNLDLLIARGPGQFDFAPGGEIIPSYWKGLEQKHVQEARNLFKEGLPKDAAGNTDYTKALEMFVRQGGAPALGTALPGIMGQQGIEAIGRIEGARPTAPLVSPSTSRNVPLPSNQPQNGYTGGDSGQGTVASLVGSKLPADHPMAGKLIINLAQAIGADPNQPLKPEQQARVTQLADAFVQRQGQQVQAQPAPMQPGAPAMQPRPMAAPQGGQPMPAQPPNAPAVPTSEATRGSQPTGPDPELQAKIAQYTILASSPNPQVAAAAKARLEALQKQLEMTPDQKNYDLARRQGFQGSLQDFMARTESDKTYAAENTKSYVKKYDTIQTAGDRARSDIPQLELARNLTDDPNFYSGVGEKYNLLLKRALVAFGGDPNTAAPQEALRKIISNSIIDQIKGQAGMGLGQVRAAEIKIMQQAAASPDNSPQANRLLIEMSSRLQKRAVAISDMAQNYNGGRLDSGFDRMVSAYDRRNPMFNDQEIQNFRKIIDAGGSGNPAPVKTTSSSSLPRFNTEAELNQAAAANKIKAGDKWIGPDGQTRFYAPRQQ